MIKEFLSKVRCRRYSLYDTYHSNYRISAYEYLAKNHTEQKVLFNHTARDCDFKHVVYDPVHFLSMHSVALKKKKEVFVSFNSISSIVHFGDLAVQDQLYVNYSFYNCSCLLQIGYEQITGKVLYTLFDFPGFINEHRRVNGIDIRLEILLRVLYGDRRKDILRVCNQCLMHGKCSISFPGIRVYIDHMFKLRLKVFANHS
jgi:hypothetical protein